VKYLQKISSYWGCSICSSIWSLYRRFGGTLKNVWDLLFSRQWLWRMPCRYFVNRRFGGTYRLHLQIIRNPRAMNQREQVYVARGLLIPWRWRRYVPTKRRWTKYLHGDTSQNTAFLVEKDLPDYRCQFSKNNTLLNITLLLLLLLLLLLRLFFFSSPRL
jgi:hypothetical protein